MWRWCVEIYLFLIGGRDGDRDLKVEYLSTSVEGFFSRAPHNF